MECVDVEHDMNIGGHDLDGMPGNSAEECRTQCQANPDCTAWVWLSPWSPPKCSLKGEGGAEAPRGSYQGFVSGLRDCKSRGLIVQHEPKLNPKTGLDHHTSHYKLF